MQEGDVIFWVRGIVGLVVLLWGFYIFCVFGQGLEEFILFEQGFVCGSLEICWKVCCGFVCYWKLNKRVVIVFIIIKRKYL